MYDANSGEPSQPERIWVIPGMRPRRSPSVNAPEAKMESRFQWYSMMLPASAGRSEWASGALIVSFGTLVVSDEVSAGSGTAGRGVVSAGARVVSVPVVSLAVVSVRAPVVSARAAAESRRWVTAVSVRARALSRTVRCALALAGADAPARSTMPANHAARRKPRLSSPSHERSPRTSPPVCQWAPSGCIRGPIPRTRSPRCPGAPTGSSP